MEKFYPIYRKVSDWAILDEITVHDFSEVERPIAVIQALIGTLHYDSIGLNNQLESRRTPIIRWITKKQYNHLLQNEGEIIW